ncbi:MAG: hypothetical protein ACFE0J_00690 [Elainellaceae cyanobacterium]
MALKVESGHGLVYLSQIVEPDAISDIPESLVKKIAKSLDDWGFNLSLPVVCLTEEEEKYQLITGLPIYRAAKESGIKQIWVLLIAQKSSEVEEAVKQVQLQSSLNERIVESGNLDKFMDFLNDSKSPLTSIPGIKEGYARLIKAKRPFTSVDEMRRKLGPKRSINWFRSYQEMSK